MCGRAEFSTVDANGHRIDLDHWHADESGHWHECENCDGKFNFEKHTLTVKETVAPTQTEQGYTVYVCDVCGEKVKGDFTDPLGE